MSLPDWVSPACAVVATASAVFANWRVGSWRKSDQTAALSKKVADLEGDVRELTASLEGVQRAHGDLPTKADFERLVGKVELATERASTAVKSIDRVEGLLIKESLTR